MKFINSNREESPIFLYREFNFSKIPEELYQPEFDNDFTYNDIGYGLNHIKNNVSLVACGYSARKVKGELFDWLANNLPIEINYCVAQQHQPKDMPSTHIVHSDIKRLYSLMYMIDTGGDNVITSWYQEKGKPRFRSKETGEYQSDSGFVGYDNLELLDSKIFEKNKWYLMATDILHDVGNITGFRQSIGISVGLNNALKLLNI
jgi:hypothetical protein